MERDNILISEFNQINDYNRTLFNILLGWYTFFVSSNLVVVGIFADKILDKGISNTKLALLISLVFIVVNIISIFSIGFSMSYFRNRIKRIDEILSELTNGNEITSPIKYVLIKRTGFTVSITLISICTFWVILILKIL